MNYVQYQTAKYWAKHSPARPVSYVARAQRRYEAAQRMREPTDPVLCALAGELDDIVGSLTAEIDRLEAKWPRTTIYPTGEAVAITRAIGETASALTRQASRMMRDPEGTMFKLREMSERAVQEQVMRVYNTANRDIMNYYATIQQPTAEFPEGGPLARARKAGLQMVSIPSLRSASIQLLRRIRDGFESLATLEGSKPYLLKAMEHVENAFITVGGALDATYRAIKDIWGDLSQVPDRFRDTSEKVARMIKYGTIAGIGVMLLWALKPSAKKGAH